MKSSFSQKIIKIAKRVIVVFIIFKIVFYVLGRFRMKNTIKMKSEIEISFFFETIRNDIFHTPNAFDSDYTWMYKLKVSESNFKSISNQIENSKYYNSEDSKPIYDSLRVNNLKGFWKLDNDLYKFYSSDEEWAERTEIEINRNDRTIEVYLVHL